MNRGTRSAAFALVAVSAFGLACASAPPPKPPTPQEPPAEPVQPAAPEPVQPTPEPEPAATPEPPPSVEPPDRDEVEGAYGPRTVVIEDPVQEEEIELTLAEAARRARARRAAEGSPTATVVITDETLAEFATGELSVAQEQATPPPAPRPADPVTAGGRGEDYWRTLVREARLRWRELVDSVDLLEAEVGRLRQEFYAEDDGFYRDNKIKPEWDRAIDRLSEVRGEIAIARQVLADVLDEGRQAGALPGWLREGIELEPLQEELTREPGEHEITEPPILDDGRGTGR